MGRQRGGHSSGRSPAGRLGRALGSLRGGTASVRVFPTEPEGALATVQEGRPKAGPEGSAAARDSRARGAGSGFARVSPPRRRRHRAATGGQVKSIRAADFIQDTEILGTGRFLNLKNTSKVNFDLFTKLHAM